MIFAFHPFWHIVAATIAFCCMIFALFQIMLIGQMKNARDQAVRCRSLKQTALIDCIVHGIFFLIFFDYNLTINTILNVIVTLYNIYVLSECLSESGIYNPNTVHNGSTLKWAERILYIKMFCYFCLMCFQFSIFAHIASKNLQGRKGSLNEFLHSKDGQLFLLLIICFAT